MVSDIVCNINYLFDLKNFNFYSVLNNNDDNEYHDLQDRIQNFLLCICSSYNPVFPFDSNRGPLYKEYLFYVVLVVYLIILVIITSPSFALCFSVFF